MASSPIAVTWETEAVSVDGMNLTHYFMYPQDLQLPIGLRDNAFILGGSAYPGAFRKRSEFNSWVLCNLFESSAMNMHAVWVPARTGLDDPAPDRQTLINVSSGPGVLAGRSDFIGNRSPQWSPFRVEQDAQDWYITADRGSLAHYAVNNRRGSSRRGGQPNGAGQEPVVTDTTAHYQPNSSKLLEVFSDAAMLPTTAGKLMAPVAPILLNRQPFTGVVWSGNGQLITYSRFFTLKSNAPSSCDVELQINAAPTQFQTVGVSFVIDVSATIAIYFARAVWTPNVPAGTAMNNVNYQAQFDTQGSPSFTIGAFAFDVAQVTTVPPPYNACSIDGRALLGAYIP